MRDAVALERGLRRIVAVLSVMLGVATLGLVAWQGWSVINYRIEMQRFLDEAPKFRVAYREYVARYGRPGCSAPSHEKSPTFELPPEEVIWLPDYFSDLLPLCDPKRALQAADPVPPAPPLPPGPPDSLWSLWTVGFLGLGVTIVAASVPWGVFFVGRWITRGFTRP